MNIDDIKKVAESLNQQNSGISEIKIIKSELVRAGNPILLLNPADYDKYFPEKKLQEEYKSFFTGSILKPI